MKAALATSALMVMAAQAWPAAAQDRATDGATGSPPERIDLTITRPPPASTEEACRRRREAAVVSGEIVVCGGVPGEDQRITSREEAQNRYAAATQGRGPTQLPELGIFRGPATVSGICVKGIFNCPKPPAVFVDVTALPQAPPGSDADRIARGLAPLGADGLEVGPTPGQRAELALPPPAPNPAESAAPAAPQ